MPVKLELNSFVKDGNIFGKKYMYMERQFGKILIGVKNWKLKSKIISKEATKNDLYAIAWTVKRKDKLIPVVVGHIPREILWFTKFFLNYGGRIEAKVSSSQYKPSPIP